LGENFIQMLTFLKKRQKSALADDIQKFIGKWQLNNATIVYFGKEMELEADEFEIIEDSLNNGLFIISDFTYTYSGNRLFPSTGKWQVNGSDQIALESNDENYLLNFLDNNLVYQMKVDDFIFYRIFFTRI
jgi:hypothetical protein